MVAHKQLCLLNWTNIHQFLAFCSLVSSSHSSLLCKALFLAFWLGVVTWWVGVVCSRIWGVGGGDYTKHLLADQQGALNVVGV